MLHIFLQFKTKKALSFRESMEQWLERIKARDVDIPNNLGIFSMNEVLSSNLILEIVKSIKGNRRWTNSLDT